MYPHLMAKHKWNPILYPYSQNKFKTDVINDDGHEIDDDDVAQTNKIINNGNMLW